MFEETLTLAPQYFKTMNIFITWRVILDKFIKKKINPTEFQKHT